MRRVALALFSTVTGLVMLLSFKTHGTSAAGVPAAVSTTGPSTGSGADPSAAGTTTTAPSSAARATTAPSKSSSASSTKTVTGDAADTRYGPVQVQITVTDGTITAVNATDYPQDNPRDAQINAFAIPQLDQEALSARSASIDMVSGATYTSEGYLSSLQSALDKAGL